MQGGRISPTICSTNPVNFALTALFSEMICSHRSHLLKPWGIRFDIIGESSQHLSTIDARQMMYYCFIHYTKTASNCGKFFNFSLTAPKLDWTSNTSRQKNNLPANQKGYNTFETTVGKLSARRIQICRVYFCKSHF